MKISLQETLLTWTVFGIVVISAIVIAKVIIFRDEKFGPCRDYVIKDGLCPHSDHKLTLERNFDWVCRCPKGTKISDE